MALPRDPKLREQLAARLQYYREMGIYDFYRREGGPPLAAKETSEEMARKREARMPPLVSAEISAEEPVGVAVVDAAKAPGDVSLIHCCLLN